MYKEELTVKKELINRLIEQLTSLLQYNNSLIEIFKSSQEKIINLFSLSGDISRI
jgi:hypothetical protein